VLARARLLSVVAILSYLAAAFLPCEPPPWFVARGSDAHASEVSTAGTEFPHPGAHHASGETSHPGSHRDSVRPDSNAGHDHAHHGGVEPAVGEPSRASDRAGVLLASAELKAKCLCGCSETRSEVGGGTARLGSVVPGCFVPRLIEPEATRAGESVALAVVGFHGDLDPIPI
jgi:hypothetical protein